jgi:uncharacterized protein YcbK (DUF882 family)
MKSYFEIEEFNRTGAVLTEEIKAKIQVHINEMNSIRERLGFPILVSKNSGYRPRAYEVSKGRSGNGEHNYEGKGAADYTCATPEKVKKLVEELKKSSKYTRICYYPNDNFVHCDYKTKDRQYFEAESPTSEWQFKHFIK